jgi:hypothetical protein
MKISHMVIAILSIFILLFFAGCDSLSPANDSVTPVETSETAASPVPSPTPTPRPTATPTGLGPQELQAFVSHMLQTNGGCELPCWWGIVSGETTWEDVGDYFSAQGIEGLEQGYLNLSYMDSEEDRFIRLLDVVMEQQDGLVQSIRVTRDYFDQPRQADFKLDWQRYELSQVLSRHGVPSQVYLRLAVGSPCIGPGVVPTYDMWVEYKDLGMAILYTGFLIDDLDNWLLCPVFGQTSDVFGPTRAIEIRLQPPGLDAPLVYIEPGDGEFLFSGTLLELANMSVEEFYNAFSSSVPQTCVLLSISERFTPIYDEKVLAAGSSLMTPEEEDAFLLDMLADNANCELPCWWGITPGVTPWQEAQQTFLSYGKNIGIRQRFAGYRDEGGNYVPSYEGFAHDVSLFGRRAQYPFDYVVQHTFYEQGGAVQLLEVIGHALGGETWYNAGWSPPQVFTQDWHNYSLDQILSRYGQPTQVLLHYWSEEETLYSLALLYEDEGIMVAYMGSVHGEYTGEDDYLLDIVDICPTTDLITDIDIWLKSPGLEDSLSQIYNAWGLGEGYYTLPFMGNRSPTLREAAGMSLEEFYSTFLDPNTQVCIQAPGNMGDMFP